jgi:hypothetical protein
MSNNVVKFPYDASRRVHSRKPRRSKNGSPEERAAKAAALFPTSADVVPMADAREQARSEGVGTRAGAPFRKDAQICVPSFVIALQDANLHLGPADCRTARAKVGRWRHCSRDGTPHLSGTATHSSQETVHGQTRRQDRSH